MSLAGYIKPSLLLFVFILQCFSSNAADDHLFQVERASRMSVGYLLGLRTVEGVSYEANGFAIDNIYQIKPGETSAFGIGSALHLYDKQGFFPIYFNYSYFPKSDKFFIDLNAGYSFSWKRFANSYPDYTVNGGLRVGAGVNYCFNLSDNYKSNIQLSYHCQLSNFNFKYESSSEQKNRARFDVITLSIGLMRIQK